MNIIKNILFTTAVFCISAFSASGLRADDIDLYTGLNPSGGNPPTVLLIWDTAANTSASATNLCSYSDGSGSPSLGASKVAGMEQCAMVNALRAIGSNSALLGKIKIGLMIFNKNGFSNNGNGQCGYLEYAPTLMDATGISQLSTLIKGFSGNGGNSILSNGVSAGTTMAEAWAMLNAKSTSCSGVNYASLAQSSPQCRDAVIIYIGNAFTNSNPVDGVGGADTLLKSELTNAFNYPAGSSSYNLFATPIAVSGLNTSGNSNNNYWADEWARFMKHVNVSDSAQSDLNVTTYTISVTDFSNQSQAQSVINYYSQMAKQGAGKTFLVDFNNSSALVSSLLTIFNEVQAVNSVFASATLPVSANTQGTYLNQVFIAMFRPDPNALPRWFGNLKQYQLGLDAGGNLVLTDSTQNPNTGPVTSKTNPVTGTISPDAVSFWTTDAPGVSGWPSTGFWINSPSGKALQFESPDGDLVEKGGAAEMNRVSNLTATYADTSNQNSRKLLTCDSAGGCTSSLTNFDTGNSNLVSNSSSLFGVSSQSAYTNVVMSAGGSFTVNGGSCNAYANSTKTCDFYVSNTSGVVLASGDTIFNSLSSSTDGSCSLPSTACTVSSSPAPTSISFDYSASAANNKLAAAIPSGTTFYKAASSITATLSNHGFSVGDTVTLTACSGQADSSNVAGMSALPSGSATYQATIQSATTNNFTFAWSSSAITLNNNVKCTVKPAITANLLINWVRGWDVANNEVEPGPCSPVNGTPTVSGCSVTVRPSLHGDVLHSRPAVVNYGGTTGIVVYYGSNDGVFHAINGNQSQAIGSVRAGGELWGFVAPEFFGKFKRLYQNTPLVNIAGVQDPGAVSKGYFFDGSTTVFQDTRTGSPTAGKTYLYLTARRGGRIVYALDVSDPKAPKFLWQKSNSTIPELGQTWSEPKVALVHGYSNPVLVMGAGYDSAEDSDPAPTSDSMGRGFVILDALTGQVVWAALNNCSGVTTVVGGSCQTISALTRSVAADITLIDRNADGYIDRLYAADVGGNIWRIDLEPNGYGSIVNTPSTWALTKLAALGGSGNNARKFFYPPDVVPTNNYDAVVAVSGDREHPLYTSSTTAGLAYNVINRFYMIEDKNTGSSVPAASTPLTESDLIDNTQPICQNNLLQAVSCTFNASTQTYVDASGNTVTPISYTGLTPGVNGFYITLGTGEKGVNAPITLAGVAYFGTNQPSVPSTTACVAPLGTARSYSVSFYSGSFTTRIFSGGGLPPSPIQGMVTIGNQTVPFIIGALGPTPFDPAIPVIKLPSSRKRAYWYYK